MPSGHLALDFCLRQQLLQERVAMHEIRRLREAVGASQIRIAKLAGVSRMRLSLAETGDVELDAKEVSAIRKAIAKFATTSAAELEEVARLVVTESGQS
jgi:transcriptional regulator with XRE-family HTH domain